MTFGKCIQTRAPSDKTEIQKNNKIMRASGGSYINIFRPHNLFLRPKNNNNSFKKWLLHKYSRSVSRHTCSMVPHLLGIWACCLSVSSRSLWFSYPAHQPWSSRLSYFHTCCSPYFLQLLISKQKRENCRNRYLGADI